VPPTANQTNWDSKLWSAHVDGQGFAVIPSVFTRHEMIRLLDDLTDIALSESKAGKRHMLGHASIAQLARDSRMMGIAGAVLGTAPVVFRATLFNKSSVANWLVTWHQDRVLPVRERRDMPGWGPWSMKSGVIHACAPTSALATVVALRVHLDDSTADTGPLRVLPETHAIGVLSENRIRELAAQVVPVDCLAAQGGVVVMRPLLVHASSKAQSSAPRRVLHLEYAPSAFVAEGVELAIV
jgi:ectoine hydroxylase-related dioxygenase (phytanoyl-CoA dioxygenase family)